MLPAPAELRNRMARLDIEAQGGAGSDRAARRAQSPPARGDPGRARRRHRPAAPAGGLLSRARARSLCQPDDRRSRDGAEPQHRRAADPRWRRALAHRSRRHRQVDRARRRCRALCRPQSRRGRRQSGADAAPAGRQGAGRRDELGPALGAGRVPVQQPLPRHPDPQGRAHLPAGAGRADARPRRQDLGAADRRHAAGHRREARPGLSGADPHHGQHQLEQRGALRPVREHAAAAGDPVARRGGRRRQQGAEAVAHARWLRPARRAAGRRADAAGRRRPDLQAQAHHAARLLWRRERAGRLQYRRPCRRAQAAGAAERRRHRPPVGGRRDRPRALVPAGGGPAAARRSLHLAVAARPAAARRALQPCRAGGAAADGDHRHPGFARGRGAAARATGAARPGRAREARPAAAQRGAGAEGRARCAAGLHHHRRQGSRRHQPRRASRA